MLELEDKEGKWQSVSVCERERGGEREEGGVDVSDRRDELFLASAAVRRRGGQINIAAVGIQALSQLGRAQSWEEGDELGSARRLCRGKQTLPPLFRSAEQLD